MKRRRLPLRPAASSKRLPQRGLLLEALEGRQMMASDVITGLGVVGEIYSDEYSPADIAAGQVNWVHLLDGRGADVGGDGTTVHGQNQTPGPSNNYDPRGTGYAYNWSLDYGTHLDLQIEGSAGKLGLQVGQGLVSHAVVMFGMQEFTDQLSFSTRQIAAPPPAGVNLPFTWYDDIYTDPSFDITFQKFPLMSSLSAAVDNLSRQGAHVVLSTIPDPSDLPEYTFNPNYANAASRDRVTAAVQIVNADIRALGERMRVPVIDLFKMQKDLLGTSSGAAARLGTVTIGGVQLNTGVGGANQSLFKDPIHPNTAMQALIANTVMAGLNQGYGANLQLFSEAEIVARIGGAFSQNTLNLNFNSYVQLPSESLIVLDFGSPGNSANDFEARMAELWAQVGSTGALTIGEINQIRDDVVSQLQSAFSAAAIGANNLRLIDNGDVPGGQVEGGNYHRIHFGLETVSSGSRNAVIGQFDQDWRNTDLHGGGFIAPEELGAVLTNLNGLDRSARIQYIRNALTLYTAQGIGLSLGLSHADAFARPQITPATYADTSGAQNVDFMSGNKNLGFVVDSLKNNVAFSFSPLAKAKLQMAIGVYDNRLIPKVETTAAHATKETAQGLTLQTVAGSSVKVDGVARARILSAGALDFYSFQADAGQLITVQTLRSQGAAASLNTVVRLLNAAGQEIAISDDTRLGFNAFNPAASAVLHDSSSLVLNVPAPATGTYYVEVSGATGTSGEYDLLIATMPANAAAGPWTNPIDPLNVDNQPGIVPIDVLLIINELNNRRFSDPDGRLRPPPAGNPPPYYDVDGDGYVIPLDALIIINYLNRNPVFDGEGESQPETIHTTGDDAGHSPAPAASDALYEMAGWFWLSDLEDEDSR